ncbi:MAG: hypothetical protein IPP29_13110 [Bacteroidetes bacterium]|nr:hypothetical protein [Bacteroidota bacterium]
MRKLLSFVAVMLFTTAMFAGNADLFNNNANAVDAQFQAIQQLDDHVTSTNVTYSELQSQNSDMIKGIKLDNNAMATLTPGGGDCPVFGIPSFLWGCFLGVAGIAIVYFVCGDKDETKKALLGCIIPSVVVIVYYIVVVATVASSVD